MWDLTPVQELLLRIDKMKRDDVVPYYIHMIIYNSSDEETVEVNQAIIKKWSTPALLYIKNKAWKSVENLQRKLREHATRKNILENPEP